MAQRQLYNKTVSQVAIPQGRMQEANAVVGAVNDVGAALIQSYEKQNELKMTKFGSEAELEMLTTTENIRAKYTDNPADPKAQQEFNLAYDKVFGAYDKDIGHFSIGQWKMYRDKVKQQYGLQNAKWAIAQNVKNAQTNLNMGIDSSLKLAYSQGMTGDIEGALLSADNKEQQLRSAVSGILPDAETNQAMLNFRSDYMKNYVMGMAQKDVDSAYAMLENPEVKKIIGDDEVLGTLKKVVSAEKSKAELNLYRQQAQNHAEFDELSQTMNIGEQITTLELGQKRGDYDNKWAEAKSSAILSKKGVDSITQAETYAKFLTRKEDIVADFESGSKDEKSYLREIKKYETDMNNAIAEGKVKKLEGLKSIQSLRTNIGKATAKLEGEGRWGFSEAEAYNRFDKQLSGTANFKAIREFFYATDGQDFSGDKMKEVYEQVLEKYKGVEVDNKAQELQSFNSTEQADSSGLATGTIVLVGGRRYQI